MALPIWIPDALRSKQRSIAQTFWRCVEAQHIISTLPLVDSLDEQRVLEDILEETKPAVPPECEGLHYLYMTPFRYDLYPDGSRFRRAGLTPGVYYVSDKPRTAIIETAFHLLLFYTDSPNTPFPKSPSEHTVFDVPIKTEASIDLTASPFDAACALWMHTSDYETCQQLEEAARKADIQLIRYASVRDPAHEPNAAILSCLAFAAPAPTQRQTWRLWLNKAGIHAICEFHGDSFSVSRKEWRNDERLAGLQWS